MQSFDFSKKLISPLTRRDDDGTHRSATPLELFFDLVYVIAIGALAHGLAGMYEVPGITMSAKIFSFAQIFFAIWWPWNLFTWVSAMYDNDDALHRITVMMMMLASMFMAANVTEVFRYGNDGFMLIGYILLRVAIVILLLRAIKDNPAHRKFLIILTIGQFVIQSFWGILSFLPSYSAQYYTVSGIGMLLELAIPNIAMQWGYTRTERQNNKVSVDHYGERFGLMIIIVLGEVLVGGTTSLEGILEHGFLFDLLKITGSSIVIVFMLWWLYFIERKKHFELFVSDRYWITWIYGHYFLFASITALSAGILTKLHMVLHNITHSSSDIHGDGIGGGEQIVEQITHASESVLSPLSSIEHNSLIISIPIAIFIFTLWLIRDRYVLFPKSSVIMVLLSILIGVSGILFKGQGMTTLLLFVTLLLRMYSTSRKTTEPTN